MFEVRVLVATVMHRGFGDIARCQGKPNGYSVSPTKFFKGGTKYYGSVFKVIGLLLNRQPMVSHLIIH